MFKTYVLRCRDGAFEVSFEKPIHIVLSIEVAVFTDGPSARTYCIRSCLKEPQTRFLRRKLDGDPSQRFSTTFRENHFCGYEVSLNVFWILVFSFQQFIVGDDGAFQVEIVLDDGCERLGRHIQESIASIGAV